MVGSETNIINFLKKWEKSSSMEKVEAVERIKKQLLEVRYADVALSSKTGQKFYCACI